MKKVFLLMWIPMVAQVRLNPDSSVTMPLATYRDIREKFYLCDTLQRTNEEIILRKDTIIMNQKFKVKSLEQSLSYKDSTITELIKIAQPVKVQKDWKFWAGAFAGLLLGVFLGR